MLMLCFADGEVGEMRYVTSAMMMLFLFTVCISPRSSLLILLAYPLRCPASFSLPLSMACNNSGRCMTMVIGSYAAKYLNKVAAITGLFTFFGAEVFYLASCLKVNIQKSNIYGIGISNVDVSSIASNSGYASGSFLFTYLGLPIGSNMCLTSSWHVSIEYAEINEIKDTCVWSLDTNGTFSVKDARCIIDSTILPSLASSTVWDKNIPRKVNIFTWRLILDRLPHKLNLSSHDINIQQISCPSCNGNEESSNHIFFECNIAKGILMLVRKWCDISFLLLLRMSIEKVGFLRDMWLKRSLGAGYNVSRIWGYAVSEPSEDLTIQPLKTIHHIYNTTHTVYQRPRQHKVLFEASPCLLKSLPELFELVMEGAYGCILGNKREAEISVLRSLYRSGMLHNELALMCPRMVEPESVKVDAYIRGLTDNIKGEVTSSKPANLNEAWESFQSGNSSGKSNQKDNSRQPSQNNQKQGNARAMTTAPNEKKVSSGLLHVCERCFTCHVNPCTIKCHKCGKVGHKARYYKEKSVATGANAQPIWTCCDYGKQGHTRNRCPKKFKQEETEKGFVGKKAGPLEEQAKHFKWVLCDWILDEIVNTEFTDVAQVANARNMEILRESYDRQGGNNNQKSWQNRGQQYNRSSGSSSQKRYPDYASPPPCDTCGKLHPSKAYHRVTRACFTFGSTEHMARDCPKNGGNGGRGNGNDNQPAAKGRVFSLTKGQAANSLGTMVKSGDH
ncbi:putative reverse transcriptase domain-containing protein [Tanacetum coccineum]|uniref:Reverse transcriptase domain-containing protein n=1 Tax=Tanacetum coccineum TaxID=301880 RepID=A0ABQ5GYP9_9ASTR